jgi:hypothetical protein
LSLSTRKFLLPFLIVDAIFLVALVFWLTRPSTSPVPANSPNIQVMVHRLEPKLTEIDLINKGNAPGSLDLGVEVSWSGADLVRSEGLVGFTEIDTGRMSLRLYPRKWPSGARLSPGETQNIGWVQLTDDSAIHAEIVTGPAATQADSD